EMLGALKEQGVLLAIDDFGTGYSSLAYLKALDVDVLKIDKAFVDGLPDDPNDSAIVHAIQAVGKSLGLELLAEGVETAEQAGWLAEQGICVGQGFLHARPMPAAELQAWMGR
ncbi:MAG: EAL domain-containing protein, partial [Thiohalorhabdaceae bacterium]